MVERPVRAPGPQDVRLYREERWTVELSEGGADSERLKPRHFASEDEARAYLAYCLDKGRGDWRKLSGPRQAAFQ